MNQVNETRSGTGGGLRYLKEEPTAEMVNQERSHSCQAACVRQLLKDAGMDFSEDDLLTRIGYIEGWGTPAENAAKVLTLLHPRLAYAEGSIAPESVAVLFRRDPWIATLRTNHGTRHAVIVDKLEQDIVHLRDPWGTVGPGSSTGTRALIKSCDFLDHWHWGLNKAIFPVSLK